jgi:protein O-mannosyl-transferase
MTPPIRRIHSGPEFAIPILLLVCGLLYIRVLGYSYIDFDDPNHIFENALVMKPSLQNLFTIWRHPYFGLYIPVTYSVWTFLAWTIQHFTFDMKALVGAFHALNLLLHGAVCIAVYYFLAGLFEKQWRNSQEAEGSALLASLIFAVHPLQVETVCWISELRDLLSVLLVVLSLIFIQKGRLRIATAMYVLALLSKPSAVGGVAMITLLNLGGEKRSMRRLSLLWGALAAIATVVTMKLQSTLTPHVGAPWSLRPLVAMDAIGFYVMQLLWPVNLLIDYSRNPNAVSLRSLVTWVHVGVAVAIVAIGYRSKKFTRWGIAFFLIALVPTLGIFSFSFQKFSTVADHYTYFAILGFAVAVCSLVRLTTKSPALIFMIALVILVGLGRRTMAQVGVWKDSETLFSATLARNPRSVIAHTNIAFVFGKQGRIGESLAHLRASVALAPDETAIRMNLVRVEDVLGNKKEALRNLVISRTKSPDDPEISRQLTQWMRENEGVVD